MLAIQPITGIQLTRLVTEEYALTLNVPAKPALREPTINQHHEQVQYAGLMNRPIAAKIGARIREPRTDPDPWLPLTPVRARRSCKIAAMS